MATAPPGSPLQTYLHSGVTKKNEKKQIEGVPNMHIDDIPPLENEPIPGEQPASAQVEGAPQDMPPSYNEAFPDLPANLPPPDFLLPSDDPLSSPGLQSLQGSNEPGRNPTSSLLQRRPVKPAMVDPLMSSSNSGAIGGSGTPVKYISVSGDRTLPQKGRNASGSNVLDPLKSRLRKSPRQSPKHAAIRGISNKLSLKSRDLRKSSSRESTNTNQRFSTLPSDDVNLTRRFFNGIIPQYRAAKFDPATVTKDTTGLAILAENGCWREVCKLCSELIKRNGTTNSVLPHTLLIVYNYRVAGLMKIGRYDQAQNLLVRIGSLDAPDKLYQNHPSIYEDRKGSMVPFNLRILSCEIWQRLDRPQPQKTIEMLFELQIRVKRELESKIGTGSKSPALIRYRAVTLTLVKYYLQPLTRGQPNQSVACKLLKNLINKHYPEDSFLHAYIGRIYLQFGDTAKAKAAFSLATKYKPDDKTNDTVMLDLNHASVMVGQGQYGEALTLLSRLLKRAPDNPVVVNNYAVCALYSNQLCGAITALEGILRTNPVKQMSSVHAATIMDNLKVFYELAGSKNSSVDMKKMLEDLVFLYAPDDMQGQILDR